MKRAGVLALQGAVSEHCAALAAVGVAARTVKTPHDLENLDALILPGGESTVLGRMLTHNGLRTPIQRFAAEKPVMGTCAGLILCAAAIAGEDDPQARCGEAAKASCEAGNAGEVCGAGVIPLGLLPIRAFRNGFGRQVESFEVPVDIEGIGEAVPGVFIRAPYIESAQPGVRILAYVDGKAVMAQYEKALVMAFHPELTSDYRVLEYFCRTI